MTDKWCYYLKNISQLLAGEHEQRVKDAPIIQKACEELNRADWDEFKMILYEEREKAFMDEYDRIKTAEQKGEKRGKVATIRKPVAKGLLTQTQADEALKEHPFKSLFSAVPIHLLLRSATPPAML